MESAPVPFFRVIPLRKAGLNRDCLIRVFFVKPLERRAQRLPETTMLDLVDSSFTEVELNDVVNIHRVNKAINGLDQGMMFFSGWNLLLTIRILNSHEIS
jgi:hypothetical protein